MFILPLNNAPKDGCGVSEYFRYRLVEIRGDGGCSVVDCENGIRTDNVFSLRQINVDWLLTLWNRHVEQLIENEEWRQDAIRLLQEHTEANPDDTVEFCDSHWQNLLPYTENLKTFKKIALRFDPDPDILIHNVFVHGREKIDLYAGPNGIQVIRQGQLRHHN